jgi:hypothetical protein
MLASMNEPAVNSRFSIAPAGIVGRDRLHDRRDFHEVRPRSGNQQEFEGAIWHGF